MSDIQLEIQRKLNPPEELMRGGITHKKGVHSLYIYLKYFVSLGIQLGDNYGFF